MKKLIITIIILLIYSSFCEAQEGFLGRGVFTKVSIPENMTEQMLTQDKKCVWAFTDKYLMYSVGDSEVKRLKVSIFQYNSETSIYSFVCTDDLQKEINVQYKNSPPEHVLVLSTDGKAGFMCHN